MKVFVDSSVLIEFVKGNERAKEILNRLLELNAEVYINDIVFSEFVFHYLSLKSGSSPLTMKGKKEVGKYINERDPKEFIDQFRILDVNESIVGLTYDLIRKYGLLPNDAIILATCKFHEIEFLVSLDRDFEEVCRFEGVKFAFKAEDIKEDEEDRT
ncbi:MAG: uncharacterized protein PWQ58_188 [Archaeoglobaceae archaeon]|nr:uncharacterized protein [Archaeoglobaceae archaeon]